MELLQLKYFKITAELEHITLAAKKLNISQPSLSKTISSLEKDLGVSLFDRRGKYIRLNYYGKVFLNKVNQALTALEQGERELCLLSGTSKGTIHLAVLAASHLLPDLLSSFRITHQDIRFNLIQHASGILQTHDFDLCISASPAMIKNTESMTLVEEEIHLAVPYDHPLAHKSSIHLKEAANENFISLKQGHSLREITDLFCHQAGFVPNVIYESDDPATVRGLIRAGQGVAFIPSITWNNAAKDQSKLLTIDEPKCERTISILYPKNRRMESHVKSFLDFALNFF